MVAYWLRRFYFSVFDDFVTSQRRVHILQILLIFDFKTFIGLIKLMLLHVKSQAASCKMGFTQTLIWEEIT